MSDYKSLSPGSKCALLLSIAYYLKSFANFYDDILKNHPKDLKDKYSKLPFLTLISERLIKEAEVYKLQDYQIDNHTVLENDFLKIGLGYHDDLYHMLLLKSFVLMYGTDLKIESEFDYFQSSLDPLSVIPTLIALFLEKHVFFLDSDLTFKAYEKLAFTFLNDYANSNELFKSHDNIMLDGDMIVKAWLQFSRMQVKSYDSELVAKKVEEFRATGNRYHKDKHYTQAALSYTEGLKLNPNSYHLLANRGAVYSALNNGEAAVIDTEKAVKLQPSSISAWTRLAFNHLYTGRAVDSFTDYNNAILACYGRIFPLNLINGSDYSQKKFTQTCMDKLNEKFIGKLCVSMQFARTRAETQGYPLKYLDDLMDPVVKEVYEEHMKAKQGSSTTQVPSSTTPPPTNGSPPMANPSHQPQDQPQIPNFGNVFTAISSNANGDFQQIFDAIHQQVTAQNGDNTNNGDAAQLGLSMLSNIVSSFMSGAQQGATTQTTEPAAAVANANAADNANAANRNLRNTNENVEMGEADDADPDIDLDDIIQDNATTARPAPNVVVTSFGGSEMPTDVRDQISRVAGGLFNFFGERRRQTNTNTNPANNNSNNNRQGGSDPGGDSLEHDLD